ncbi:MAG: hypothetical protein U0R51_10375 [Solirubrobacterales bacterium]
MRPALFLVALVACLAPAAADASQSDNPLATRALSFHGTSPDGTHAYVQTPEQLVRADTDQMIDVYDIDDGVAKLVSIGPDGGNRNGTCLSVADPSHPELPPYTESCDSRFQGASGGRVYFRSESLRASEDANGKYEYHRDGGSLAPAGDAIAETEDDSSRILQDRDGCLFQQDSGGTTLISTGPAVDGGGCPAGGDFHFVSQTEDGSTVFFLSKAALVTVDTDDQRDLYRSRNGEPTLISTGPADTGGGSTGVRYGNRRSGFETISTADGETVVFRTSSNLTADDVDSVYDIYLRTGTTTTLVSGTGASAVELVGQSDDLGTIFFETTDALDPAVDTNGESDVYRWKDGTISLLALDPAGQAFANGSTFLDASADGTKVFFYAWETPGFATGEIYERSADTTTQLSTPGTEYQYWSDWVGASDDGSKAYFDSNRSLANADDDGGKADLYRYENGILKLISADPSPVDPADADDATAAIEPLDDGDPLSDDGSRIYFRSKQSMSPDDTDCGRMDFYEHSDSGNRLVTAGADAPTIGPGACAFDTNTPTFDLVPANPGGELQCRIDQEAWKACPSSFTPDVNNGEHVLYVRGDTSTDQQSGVADRRFTVEADQPPNTTISAGPTYSWDFMKPDEYRRPSFSFVSSEQTGHFECRFDEGAYAPCDQSDAAATGVDRPDQPLSWGQHKFEVAAVDGAGNVDPSPASRTFTMAPYAGELELELADPGTPTSLRTLGRDGLKPVVRCSAACLVKAKVTLSFKRKGERRSIRFGAGSGESGLKATTVRVLSSAAARRALPKVKRASLRIEIAAKPSDGDGDGRSLTRIAKLRRG